MKDWKIINDKERERKVLVHVHEASGWMAACHTFNGRWICGTCGPKNPAPEEIAFCAELARCYECKVWYGLDYGKLAH